MRANENTMILDKDVALVPYREEHVATYNDWMTSPELQELTASEPLSLEEEYAMQKKWRHDEDKLTFIICARQATRTESSELSHPSLTMIGDVNLFIKGSRDDPDDEFEVEVEIMIAEPAYRRRGLARTALHLMLSYATSASSPSPLPVPKDRFVARIGEKNQASIRLFESLGFVVTKKVAVFEEVEMRLPPEAAAHQSWVSGELRPYA